MKKILFILIVLLLTGCVFKSTKTFTITTDNGEEFTIKMKKTEGYSAKTDGVGTWLTFTKNGDQVAKGVVVSSNYYDTLYDDIADDSYVSDYQRLDRSDAKIVCYYETSESTNICRIKPNDINNEFAVMYGNMDDLKNIVNRLSFK